MATHRRVHFADKITRHPGKVFAIVMILTILFFMINISPGIFGLTQHTDESEDSWLPETELAETVNDLRDNYGSNVVFMQLLVKGKNDNVLAKDALVDILNMEKEISENETVQYVLFPQPPNIMSVASAMAQVIMMSSPMNTAPENITYDSMILTIQSLSQSDIDNMILGMWNSPDPAIKEAMGQFSTLLSKDFIKNVEAGTPKAKATLVLVMLDSKKFEEIDLAEDENPILDASLAVVELIDDADFQGVKYMGVNEEQYMNHVMNTDPTMGYLFMGVIIIIIIIVFITYRSIFDTIISMLSIFFAIIWMNAIGILIGLTFGMLSQAVPIILIGIGIDYAIHITLRYREGREHERKAVRGAMLLAIATVGASLFLSSLTTGISFSSNTISPMAPMREFGIFLMLGIFCAFIVVVTFIPSVKILADTYKLRRENKLIKEGKLPKSKHKEKYVNPSRKPRRHAVLSHIAAASTHRPMPIIAITVIVTILFAYFAIQLETEFDFKEFLPRDAQITDDISYTFDNFDFGVDEADVLIRGDVTQLAVLSAMDETQTRILDNREATHVNEGDSITSILTIIQDIRTPGEDFDYDSVFDENYTNYDSNNDGIPDQNVENLFTILMNDPTYGPKVINVLYYNEKTAKFEGALIRVGVDSQAGDFNEDIFNEMNDNIKPLEDVDEIEVFATGDPILMHVIITSIQDSGIQSLGITVVVAGLILTILFIFEFRSFALGIMTLIPVILVICWIYGTMYLAGIPLNVFTIMVSTITIGIGVDYAIHITNRFMESLHDYGNVDEGIDSTIVNTGAALGGAAVTTVGGFLILYMAPANPMRMFGSITALSITFSLIGSILILPAFLGLYAKRKLAKDPKYFEKHVDITAIRDHVSEHLHAFEKNLRKIGPIMIEANHQLAHKISDFGKEMERAGKKIGEAAGKAGKQIEEGVKKAGDGVVKTSDKLGKKIDEVEEAIKKEFKKG